MPRGFIFLLPVMFAASAVLASDALPVDYNRDVRPILSNYCYPCHGPDEQQRKAGLRFDVKENAFAELESGDVAIVPGQPGESSIVERLESTDADVVMPPPASGKKLSPDQVAILKRWVAEGAAWKSHWSFMPPARSAVPEVAHSSWPRNTIDRFALSKLEAEGLRPSAEADRATLARRVTLDLTGLPPTTAEIDAFLLDNRSDAYERLVDRLLASPHYGERMALEWLDASRYADTHGYHIDSHRDMFRWRDWVIDAFNRNMSFDRFTVEQLAGDLLPGATDQQKLATGFNRNHMINFEGGAIPEEYHAAYIVDRVNTTATVWLGLTVGCAQCHDHKYDAITQKDYYRFFAFFNNVPEQGLDGRTGNAEPFIKAPTQDQAARLAPLRSEVAQLSAQIEGRVQTAQTDFLQWAAEASSKVPAAPAPPAGLVAHFSLDETEGNQAEDFTGQQPAGTIQEATARVEGKVGGAFKFDGTGFVDLGTSLRFERNQAFSYGAWVRPASEGTGAVIANTDDESTFRGWDLLLIDGKAYAHVVSQWPTDALRIVSKSKLELDKWTHLLVTYDGSSKAAGLKLYINGVLAEVETTHDHLTETIINTKTLRIGSRRYGSTFKGSVDEARIYNRELTAADALPLTRYEPIEEFLRTPADKRSAKQVAILRKHYLDQHDAVYRDLVAKLTAVRKRANELDATIPTTMVMQEMGSPRPTRLMMRGQYDKLGEQVEAGVPQSLPSLPADAPRNRLGLARWLVDPAHPLTSRVIVNRFWQMYFGTGIVKTAEDFGSQGEWPTHAELLDYLASELISSGWDVKAMQRLIVTSATYRQSSIVTPALAKRDPENRLLARGPRMRLQAEFIRDQALAVSGLLNMEIGGPSVYPYQPAGLWEEMSYGEEYTAQKYGKSSGKDLYRRSMYTFWKRTVPPAQLSTFDAPDRETCAVRRSRTNTPLQALVLMNDPTYVEASRKLGEQVMSEPAAVDQRVASVFRMATGRRPSASESAVLVKLLVEQLAVYRQQPEAARKLVAIGESKRDEKLDACELAAWTMVISTIFNLDETITKG